MTEEIKELFMVPISGSYGADDYYLVKSVSSEEANSLAKAKYEKTKKYSGDYTGHEIQIVFDDAGVSQLLTNHW